MQFLRSFNEEVDRRRLALRNTTLGDFKTAFLTYSRSVHTPSTVESNEMAFRVFVRHFAESRMVQQVSAADCERFIAGRVAATSAHSGLRLHRTLGAAFERAKSWGLIEENPRQKVKKPKAPEVIPAFFTRAQFRTLLAAKERSGELGPGVHPVREGPHCRTDNA